MDEELENVLAKTQQTLREILILRQEMRKLEFAYDELQQAALQQLQTEWKEAFSDFPDIDRLLRRTARFALNDRTS